MWIDGVIGWPGLDWPTVGFSRQGQRHATDSHVTVSARSGQLGCSRESSCAHAERGPHENYWDRRTGAAVGLYSGRVADQIHPYVRPQESGYKTDVRWVALANRDGVGLLAVGLPLVSTSASPFLPDDYDSGRGVGQKRTIDMTPRDVVVFNVDFKQMGVGGDTSWGAKTHPEYTLPARPYAYRFRLRPFTPQDGQLSTLGKQAP